MKVFFEVKKGFEIYGKTIAAVINSFLLTIVYFFGIGVTSIFAKIMGKSFLKMALDPSEKTYWTELNLGGEGISSYYNQF